MVYLAGSRSLAALEMLVHLDAPKLLDSYTMFDVSFDSSSVKELAASELPAGWRGDPVPGETQAIGDSWVASAVSPVLRVPSTLIPEESNFLVNPRYPRIFRLRVGDPKRFAFDPRLKSP
jgi:RES domain-containing protein